MRKSAVLLILICIVLSGCKADIKENTEEITIEKTDEIQLLLDSMSLDEKVGQLFIIRPDALTTSISLEEVDNVNADGIKQVTEEMRYLYSQYPVGGFVLFNKNLKDEEQLVRLTSDLKKMGAGRIEPLICIDEEGGKVARIANNGNFDVEKFEEMEDIASANDTDRAKYLGKTIGSYLEKYGIDQDFAPVCDVNTNPANNVIGKRAFGSDPKTASDMIRNVIEGMHESGTLSCIKHFPGHGDTLNDTHNGYAETLKTWDELLNCEMIPFIEGIKAGCDMVMVAHIAAENITGSKEPATLSYKLVTEKLRNELEYDGVIITDSFAMGAITKYYSSADAAVMAIQAGVDIVLMPEDCFSAFDGVKKAVENGTISYERLNESVYRILKLKSEK